MFSGSVHPKRGKSQQSAGKQASDAHGIIFNDFLKMEKLYTATIK